MRLNVENFGKIKSASVDLNTPFVLVTLRIWRWYPSIVLVV